MLRNRVSFLSSAVPCQIAIFTLMIVGIFTLFPSANAIEIAKEDRVKDEISVLARSKRQYYGDDYYGSYYGCDDYRNAGRIIGWILGFIVLLLIICVPCVCCVGIWFAGWFGLRQAMARRRRAPGTQATNGIFSSSGGVIHRTTNTESPSSAEQRVVYAHASDRYFERRPRTPPPNTSTSNEYRRT